MLPLVRQGLRGSRFRPRTVAGTQELGAFHGSLEQFVLQNPPALQPEDSTWGFFPPHPSASKFNFLGSYPASRATGSFPSPPAALQYLGYSSYSKPTSREREAVGWFLATGETGASGWLAWLQLKMHTCSRPATCPGLGNPSLLFRFVPSLTCTLDDLLSVLLFLLFWLSRRA
ncbi:uncharacterized protein BJX67DRAFT_41044 [Aspergillus lucknowensis]|uniref:Uncharacterized protein n=1 Tax=Aspergillus lucknowensis TaxID=176173 RepID=A0ABR4LYK6_9EURO